MKQESGKMTNGNLSGHGNKTVLESSFNEATAEDINLSSFKLKNKLNPKFWKDNILDSRIRLKLLDIADDFVDFMDISWAEPVDIVMTGSLANYNWSDKYSDIDIHIIYDFEDVDENEKMVENFFYSQKCLWNEKHSGIKICGFPVELYVENNKENDCESGVYSLEKNAWLKKPDKVHMSTKDLNTKRIKKVAAKYATMIEDLIFDYEGETDSHKCSVAYDKAVGIFDEIVKLRRDGLSASGKEMNDGNIIFKQLRRMGCIEQLDSFRTEMYDKMNSIYEIKRSK